MAAIQDATVVEQALPHGVGSSSSGTADLVHHSDRGSTYTAESYQAILKQNGIQVSMSRPGNCSDHAAMESFAPLARKRECVDRECFQTRAQARRATFEYIECFYHRTRRHSTLNSMSPVMYEQVMS